MLILKMPSDEQEKEETAIVELQGDLECRTDATLGSQFIGDLYFKFQDGAHQPILIIGHHILTGKLQSLDKPLAVVKRIKLSDDSAEFLVKSIVTKKIIFKTRPKPIIINY